MDVKWIKKKNCLKCPRSGQKVKISHFAIHLNKNVNFKKPTQISMFLDRIWSLFLFFYKSKKTLPELMKFRWITPFFIIRPWFSFWACASSFSEKSFLFSAAMGSYRINTLTIKCDKLYYDWNFLPASLILVTLLI